MDAEKNIGMMTLEHLYSNVKRMQKENYIPVNTVSAEHTVVVKGVPTQKGKNNGTVNHWLYCVRYLGNIRDSYIITMTEKGKTMDRTITADQYEELTEAHEIDDQKFKELLEEYTGIEMKSYTAHMFYDEHGNYLGDDYNFDLDSILANAWIEVKDND